MHIVAECPKLPYLCIVFFIVLDLRLTRLGYSGIPFFLCLYGRKGRKRRRRGDEEKGACDRMRQRGAIYAAYSRSRIPPLLEDGLPPQKKNSLSRGAHHAPQEREFFSSGFRASSLGRSETTVETKGEADEDEEDAAIGHSGSGGD